MLSLPFTAPANDKGVVLVTGANRGLGLEFVQQLQAKGYEVIGTARSPQKATELNATGARVEQLDVADAASVAALAERGREAEESLYADADDPQGANVNDDDPETEPPPSTPTSAGPPRELPMPSWPASTFIGASSTRPRNMP